MPGGWGFPAGGAGGFPRWPAGLGMPLLFVGDLLAILFALFMKGDLLTVLLLGIVGVDNLSTTIGARTTIF